MQKRKANRNTDSTGRIVTAPSKIATFHQMVLLFRVYHASHLASFLTRKLKSYSNCCHSRENSYLILLNGGSIRESALLFYPAIWQTNLKVKDDFLSEKQSKAKTMLAKIFKFMQMRLSACIISSSPTYCNYGIYCNEEI